MKNNVLALKAGLIKHTRRPGLIREVDLLYYLSKYCGELRLCKAIAYSMLIDVDNRTTSMWTMAFNSTYKSKKDWNRIAITSFIDNPSSLKDYVLVDYSVLDLDKELVLTSYKWFSSMLVNELFLLRE